ncbi:unnamed protein product [Closterium sp. Naga37s-1]|nr:unnamed protein product [Closterium sp. Naga37s-1]
MGGPSDQISVSPALQPNSASATPAGVQQPSALPSAASGASPPRASLRLIPLRGARSARAAESPYAIVPNSTVTAQSASATRFVPLRLRLGKIQHQQQRREVEGETDIANQGDPILVYSKEYLIYYGNWPEGSGQDVIENFKNSLGGDTGNRGDPAGENSVRSNWDISTNYYQNNDDGSQTFVSPEVMLDGTVPVTDDCFNGWESIDGTFTDDGSDGWESIDGTFTDDGSDGWESSDHRSESCA